MSALLSIAPELRDQILHEVLFQPGRAPPKNPAASRDRKRRKFCEDSKCSDGHDIWVKQDGFFPTTTQTPPILLVNRQMYEEAAGILARRKLHYHLDIMYVKECGLWPTWLSVPRLAHHVESIHCQFRIFDPPPSVNPDWRNKRQFVGGDGGPPMVVWNFFALLKDYLRYGPSAFEGLVAQSSVFTVNRLILDVVPPPPGTKDDNLGFPRNRSAPDRHMLEAFARGRHAKYWPLPPEGCPHLMVAEKMGFFLASKIGALLSMYDDYGKCLYEHIGSIEIRVGGHQRRVFDLDELMGILPPTPIQEHSPEATAEKQKVFDEWRAATLLRRDAWQ